MKNKKIIIIIVVVLFIIMMPLILKKFSKKEEVIDWSNYDENNISLNDSITIKNGGVYNLTGSISDGLITVDTKDSVKLVLNNVDIKNANGPAIYVENADNVSIYLTSGSVNNLEDGSTYSSSDINGVIYSKDDLVFDGSGVLNIKANYEDGIVGKDDIKFIDGTYNITSSDDAIRGRDSISIAGGTYNIDASGDAIKVTNDSESKGNIEITNGIFNLTSSLDGIQAESNLIIKNGEFTIKTGGGSSNVSTSSNWGNWGPMRDFGESKKVDTESAKGLKANDNLIIENGSFNFDTSDDAIHSNNCVNITNGDFTILSGDDGIHASDKLIIDGGNILISKSYEGLEASSITINDGDIKVVSTDDGINVAGGNDSSSMNRPGANNFNSNSNNVLTINGGNIYVDASGDGLDMNGSGYMYGGNVVVYGPSDNGNGALDYDNEFVVNGGTLVAGGSSGMLQGVSSNSTQYNVTIAFNTTLKSNSKVKIVSDDDTEVLSYTSDKSFSSIVVSSDKLKKGVSYTVYIDDTKNTSFTINSISTNVGNVNNNMMPQGRR